MRTISKTISMALLAMLLMAGVSNRSKAQRESGSGDADVRDLFRRIETDTDMFRRNAQNAMDRASRDELNNLIADFADSASQLNRRSMTRQPTQSEVRATLDRAVPINNFFLNNRIGLGTQRDWELLRGDLDQLARAYNLNWQWNARGAVGSTGNNDYGLSDAQMR